MMISREDSDKISSLMGTYLLQGYTLLDDYCQLCKTPLMRKKFDQSFCLYCDHIKSGNHDNRNNDNGDVSNNNDQQTPSPPTKLIRHVPPSTSQAETMIITNDDSNSTTTANNPKMKEIRENLQSSLLDCTKQLNRLTSDHYRSLQSDKIDRIQDVLGIIERINSILKKL